MAVTLSRQLAKLGNWQRTDGGPVSARLLQELGRAFNTAKSRIVNPVLVNDAWTGTNIRKTTGTTETTFASYPQLPLHPGATQVRARLRVAVVSGGGEVGTWRLYVIRALHKVQTFPSESASVTSSATSPVYVDITISNLSALAGRETWWNPVYLAVRAFGNVAATQLQLSGLTVWQASRDNVVF